MLIKRRRGIIMKRSEINKALHELEDMCAKYKFALPPFCHFTDTSRYSTQGGSS